MKTASRHRFRPSVVGLDRRVLLSLSPDPLLTAYGMSNDASASGPIPVIQHTFTTRGGVKLNANGSGETIALIEFDFDSHWMSDLQIFDKTFTNDTLPDPPAMGQENPMGLTDTSAEFDGETALDVEWAHAVAPGANILVQFTTPPTTPGGDATSIAQAAHLAAMHQPVGGFPITVVSMSVGTGESYNEKTLDNDFVAIDSAGLPVTFLAASSDTVPNESVTNPNTVYPTSSPNVISVGGTSLQLTGAPNNPSQAVYVKEIPWNYNSFTNSAETYPTGGGTGLSLVEPQPSYQQGIPGITSPARQYPDVSMDADEGSGVYVVATVPGSGPKPYNVGGTSLAAPLWAGIIAIEDQGMNLNGNPTLSSAGVDNLLYQGLFVNDQRNGSIPVSQKPFETIYAGPDSYSQVDNGTSYTLLQAGLGSPNGYYFLNDYASGLITVNL